MFRRQLLAAHFDVKEVVGEVLTRVVDVVLHLFAQVLVQLKEVVPTSPRLGVNGLERVVHKLAEQRLVFFGKPEHASNDVDRDVLRILNRSIDGVARRNVAHFVKQAPAENLDFGLPRFDLLWSEWWQQQTTRHSVERRVTRDRRHDANRRRDSSITWAEVGDHDTATREVLRVVRNVIHRLVRNRSPHAPVTIGMGNRAADVAQFLPHLRRIRVVAGIGVIDVSCPVGDRPVVIRVVGSALPRERPLRSVGNLQRFGGLDHVSHPAAQSEIVIAYSGQFDAARRALASRSTGTSPSPIRTASP